MSPNIWSLLFIEPCLTCSQVYFSDCSVPAEPTDQILLINFTPSKLQSWFKSCKHRSWGVYHNFRRFESNKGGLILITIMVMMMIMIMMTKMMTMRMKTIRDVINKSGIKIKVVMIMWIELVITKSKGQ